MEHVEQRLQAEGFDTVVLWVLDDNPRAAALLRAPRVGGDGHRRHFDDYCDVSVPEVEYRKELS